MIQNYLTVKLLAPSEDQIFLNIIFYTNSRNRISNHSYKQLDTKHGATRLTHRDLSIDR